MRYEILGILISCYLTFIQHAFGFPDEPLQPLNELGVTLDYSLAKWAPPGNWNARQIPRNYLLSSHITFNGPVNQITDAHLWKLAIVAYSYLEPDIVQYEIDTTNTPGALTILAWGNEIILASSQKGYNSYTYQGKESKVSKILEKCQATYLEKVPGGQARRHRTKGNELRDQNAVIGTVGRNPDSGIIEKKDPCGPGTIKEWGCTFLVDDQNIRVLDSTTKEEDYVLGELAGGVASVDQIQLCGTVRKF